MPYADQNDYNRYQSCDCENKDNCNCNDACGCCPIGTIEVKDECGNHVACLLPADASQYYIDTLTVPEGFVKVFDSEGVFIGLLTVAQYAEWVEINTPPEPEPIPVETGVNVNNTDISQPADTFLYTGTPEGGSEQMTTLEFDRNNYFGDLVLNFVNLYAGITGNTPITIPASKSRPDIITGFPTITFPASIPNGVYNFGLQVTGVNLTTFVIPVTLTIS